MTTLSGDLIFFFFEKGCFNELRTMVLKEIVGNNKFLSYDDLQLLLYTVYTVHVKYLNTGGFNAAIDNFIFCIFFFTVFNVLYCKNSILESILTQYLIAVALHNKLRDIFDIRSVATSAFTRAHNLKRHMS